MTDMEHIPLASLTIRSPGDISKFLRLSYAKNKTYSGSGAKKMSILKFLIAAFVPPICILCVADGSLLITRAALDTRLSAEQ